MDFNIIGTIEWIIENADVNLHLLDHKSTNNAYKVDHIGLSKRLFKGMAV